MAERTVLAVDLGAESGRVMGVQFNGRSLHLTPLHRFANHSIALNGTLYWDFLNLWREIQQGIAQAKPLQPASVGVDAWGVDFGLLDRQGHLLGNVVQYRDGRTQGMMEKAFAKVSKKAIFTATGIQFARLNSLYQLLSMVQNKSPQLEIAHTFLTVPDLVHYLLSGTAVSEFSIATTTQMLNPRTHQWTTDILSQLGIPTHIFPDVVPPGTQLGHYQEIPVIAPASHDTGSAVVAVPTTTSNYAYISSGTWSLVGLEADQPIINEAALQINATNEGGAFGTIRFLKNVMGLWLLQQCRSSWVQTGHCYTYEELEALAVTAPALTAFVNPDASRFLPPGNHPELIRQYCLESNQSPPQTIAETVRCVLESLALAYCDALQKLSIVANRKVDVIHIIGGGSKNALLNQMTANATGIPVVAGPVEASALGNAIVQFISLGDLRNVEEARQLLWQTLSTQQYEPQDTAVWQEAYQRYQTIISQE